MGVTARRPGPDSGPRRRRRARPGSGRPRRRSPSGARRAGRACAARAGRGSSRTDRAPRPIAFWRKRSRSARSSRLVTATPDTVSEWPARYFVDGVEDDVGAQRRAAAGAPARRTCCRRRASGRSRARAAVSVESLGDGLDVDDLEVRVRRRLEPDERGSARRDRPAARRPDRTARSSQRVVDPARPGDPLEEPPGPAVDVVAGEHDLARRHELGDRGRGRRAAGEGDPVAAALERRDGPLEPLAGRVLGARVLVAAGRPPDALLRVRARLVDRRRDRAGQLVGLLAGVDRERLEAVGLVASLRQPPSDGWWARYSSRSSLVTIPTGRPSRTARSAGRAAGQLTERLGQRGIGVDHRERRVHDLADRPLDDRRDRGTPGRAGPSRRSPRRSPSSASPSGASETGIWLIP